MRNIQQRLYRGFCRHNDVVPGVIDEFRALEAEIIGLFENEERLDSRNRNSANKIIGRFYSSLEDSKDIQKKLTGNCRG